MSADSLLFSACIHKQARQTCCGTLTSDSEVVAAKWTTLASCYFKWCLSVYSMILMLVNGQPCVLPAGNWWCCLRNEVVTITLPTYHFPTSLTLFLTSSLLPFPSFHFLHFPSRRERGQATRKVCKMLSRLVLHPHILSFQLTREVMVTMPSSFLQLN